jgi:hypothetical protein
MPYKHTEKKIPEELDRRCKLTKQDRIDIASLKGECSIHHLAKAYGVSRRLIQFIQYPERHKQPDHKKYYDKDKHRKYMKDHRRYKQELYVKGELK